MHHSGDQLFRRHNDFRICATVSRDTPRHNGSVILLLFFFFKYNAYLFFFSSSFYIIYCYKRNRVLFYFLSKCRRRQKKKNTYIRVHRRRDAPSRLLLMVSLRFRSVVVIAMFVLCVLFPPYIYL